MGPDRPPANRPGPGDDPASGGGNAGPFPGTEKRVGVSADGRYVVFSSYATDLVANDNNGQRDVFVRDTKTGRTTLVELVTRRRRVDRHVADARLLELIHRVHRGVELPECSDDPLHQANSPGVSGSKAW